ncbi:MAG: OPT/YSL family transporter [Candidatus Bathyarchaeia archaeon]
MSTAEATAAEIEVRVTKGRWVFLIAAIFLAAVYGTLVNFYITWGGGQFSLPWEMIYVGQAIGMMTLITLINRYVLSRFPRIQLRAQDILILYSAWTVGLPIGSWWWHRWHFACMLGIQHQPPYNVDTAPYLAKHYGLWVPPAPVTEPAIYGGGSPPWGSLIVPIAFWCIWIVGTFLLGIGIALMVRRRWVDVERLTYPLGMVPALFVMNSLAKDEEGKSAWKIIAIIVAAMWLASRPIYLINSFRPGTIVLPAGPVPAFGVWNFLVLSWGSFDIPWNLNRYEGWWTYMLPRVPLCFVFNSYFIMALYLLPLEVLNGILVGWLVFQIIYPMVAFYAGWLPFFPPQDTPYIHQTLFSQNNGLGAGMWNPLMPQVMFVFGGLPALFIWPIVLGWKDYKAVFSCILRPNKEYESKEPLPYRYAFLMIVSGFIILLTLWIISGGSPLFAVVMIALAAFYTMGLARIRGETGILPEVFTTPSVASGPAHHIGIGLGLWPEVIGTTPRREMGQTFFTNMYLTKVIAGNPTLGTFANFAVFGMESFKIASLSRCSLKDMLIACTAAMIITAIVTHVLTWHLAYTVGIMNGPGYRFWFSSVMGVTSPGGYYSPDPGQVGFWPQILAGFFIVGGLFFAKLRFPGFPINPAGLVLGNSYTIYRNIQPVSALIAWILKVITFRVGGVKAYTKYGIPIAIGIIAGHTLNTFTSYVTEILLSVAPWLRIT